jgi:hypothetical protein
VTKVRAVRLWFIATTLLVAVLIPPGDAMALGATPAAGAASAPVVVGRPTAVGALSAEGPRGRLIVGDSLTVAIAAWMRPQGFDVHAKVGRQFSTAPGIVRGFGSRLPRNVIIALGTNGTVSAGACRRAVRTAGRNRRVFLVTSRVPRSWEVGNLRALRSCNRSFAKKRVKMINWYGHSAGHPEWFGGDRVHMTASGQRAYRRLIDRVVDSHSLR